MVNGVKGPIDIDICPNIGSYSNTTDLYSALEAFGNNMVDHETKNIYFECTASPFYDAHTPRNETWATIYRSENGRYFLTCYNALSSNIPVILLWKWSGGWATKSIPLT